MDAIIAALLGPIGALAGALYIIHAFVTGRVPTNSLVQQILKELRDTQKDRDFWRRVALSGMSLSSKLLEIKKKEVQEELEELESES